MPARFTFARLNLFELGTLSIPLLLFWAVLFSGLPASFSQYFHRYYVGLFLVVLALYDLSFRLPDRFQFPVCLGLTMALFALPLSYLWASGFSDNFIIGGLLPYKDGKNFYFGANLILNGLPLVGANQATERPLFPGFLASLLLLTGQNLKITLAILVQLMGVGLHLAAQQMRKAFGPLAAALFAVFSYFYIRPWIGYTMSETLGFAAGCFGFTLLWLASYRLKWFDLFLGLAVLLVAVSARAGAFFIFPILAIWMGRVLRGSKMFSWKIAASGLAFLLVGYFLVNSVYAQLLGIPPGSSFGNLSYAVYGQAHGGTGWHSAIEELGTRDSAIVYRAAWQYFLKHPISLFIGFAKSYRDFFLWGEQGIFPFVGGSGPFWLNFILWLGTLILIVRGLMRSFRDIGSNPSSLLLAGFIGLFLSIPFLPPVDGGTRFYASTLPFFFALPAVGVSRFLNAVQTETPSNRDFGSESIILRWISVIVVVLIVVLPPVVHSLSRKPAYDLSVCPSDEVPFVMEFHPGSYIDLIKDKSSRCGFLPEVCLNDFDRNNPQKSIDDFYQELFHLMEDSDTRVLIIPGIDFVTEEFHYTYISHDKLSGGLMPNLISGCAVRIATKNQIISQVASIVPEIK